MDITPEDALAELTQIRLALDSAPADAPDRAALEDRRDELRRAARDAADATRNAEALAAELAHLERRLATMDNERISVPAWQISMSPGGKLSNDPAAYASKLNEALEAATATDRAHIEERISRLKRAINE